MNSADPVVSIALLVKNGMPELSALLESLRSQKVSTPLEIVAVDSGSTDGSLCALRAAGARIIEIEPKAFRFGPTRQLAFSHCRGQVIVTLSQDTLPMSDQWLAAMSDPILQGQADIVQSQELAPEAQRAKLDLYNFTWPYKHWTTPHVALSCAGMAISRTAWEATGFGDVPMSEDKHLAVKAREQNLRVAFSSIPLLHGHGYGLRSLAKRCFNEGLGAHGSDGRYTFGMMARDLVRVKLYQKAASMVFVQRTMKLREAALFPIRPIFLYLGFRFGKSYWK